MFLLVKYTAVLLLSDLAPHEIKWKAKKINGIFFSNHWATHYRYVMIFVTLIKLHGGLK